MADEIEAFFGGYSEDVATLAKALRKHVKKAVPNATETLHTGWKVVSYGYSKKFCAIAPHSEWINLQFHDGAALDTDTQLLQGTGKSMRHTKIHRTSDLNSNLTALIRQAADRA